MFKDFGNAIKTSRADSPGKTAKTADKPIRPAGFFHGQDPTVQMAIVKDIAVKQHARYRSVQDELRDRHDVHHDERRAAAKEEFRAKLQAKVDNAVHYHGSTRAASHAEVDQLLLGNAGGKQVELLLAQIKHRMVGCGQCRKRHTIFTRTTRTNREIRDNSAENGRI